MQATAARHGDATTLELTETLNLLHEVVTDRVSVQLDHLHRLQVCVQHRTDRCTCLICWLLDTVVVLVLDHVYSTRVLRLVITRWT